MRLVFRLLTILAFLSCLVLPGSPNGEAGSVVIPERSGSPVLLDGVFSPGEWDGAWTRDLGSGVQLSIMKMKGHVFIGIRFSPFRGNIADLFISPDGRTVTQLHASAQIGERKVLDSSGPWDNPEFVWGDTSGWYANEIRWNQQNMDRLLKEGRKEGDAQGASFYRYDGFEFQIKAEKFNSRTWAFRIAVPIPPDWDRPIVYPAGTGMTKTEGWLRLVLE
jgi:hypothetical protein